MADHYLVNILCMTNKEERNQKLKQFFDNQYKIDLSNIINDSSSRVKHFGVIKNLFDYLLMQKDSNCYDIDLSCNKFGDNLIILNELNNFIKLCVCIEFLNLSTNHFNDEHILILCDGISANQRLTCVNLWNNDIGNAGLNYLKGNPNIFGRVRINTASNHIKNDPTVTNALFRSPKQNFQKARSQINISSREMDPRQNSHASDESSSVTSLSSSSRSRINSDISAKDRSESSHSRNSHTNSEAIDNLDDLLEELKREPTNSNESRKSRSSIRPNGLPPNSNSTGIKRSTSIKQNSANSVHSFPVRENSSLIDEDEFDGHEAPSQDSMKSKLPLPPLPIEILKRISSSETINTAAPNAGMTRHSRISLEDRKSANEITPLATEARVSNKKPINPSNAHTLFPVDRQTKAREKQTMHRSKDDRHSRISIADRSSVTIVRP